ncbi:hypothetical protein IWQ57_001074, partial [Coemansia nantahalensis]
MADGNPPDPHETSEPSRRPSRSGQPAPAPLYAPIRPRGNPDEHRQALAEEKELVQSQALSRRRRKNASAAARMRERQREKERALIQRKNELVAQERQLQAEVDVLRAQRQQHE